MEFFRLKIGDFSDYKNEYAYSIILMRYSPKKIKFHHLKKVNAFVEVLLLCC